MPRTQFTVEVHPSVKVSPKARAAVAVAMGSAAAAELARLDLGGRVAFIPDIKWPGGRIDRLTNPPLNQYIKVVEGGGN